MPGFWSLFSDQCRGWGEGTLTRLYLNLFSYTLESCPQIMNQQLWDGARNLPGRFSCPVWEHLGYRASLQSSSYLQHRVTLELRGMFSFFSQTMVWRGQCLANKEKLKMHRRFPNKQHSQSKPSFPKFLYPTSDYLVHLNTYHQQYYMLYLFTLFTISILN